MRHYASVAAIIIATAAMVGAPSAEAMTMDEAVHMAHDSRSCRAGVVTVHPVSINFVCGKPPYERFVDCVDGTRCVLLVSPSAKSPANPSAATAAHRVLAISPSDLSVMVANGTLVRQAVSDAKLKALFYPVMDRPYTAARPSTTRPPTTRPTSN